MEFDPCENWYHGSPYQFSVLHRGSTITQKRELARIFSHNPTIVSVGDDGRIRHNGTEPGYLYIVLENIGPEDVIPHPHSTMEEGDEWVTTRDLHVNMISLTTLLPEEQLTDKELAELIKRSWNHH
jgi:hypothetical protein